MIELPRSSRRLPWTSVPFSAPRKSSRTLGTAVPLAVRHPLPAFLRPSGVLSSTNPADPRPDRSRCLRHLLALFGFPFRALLLRNSPRQLVALRTHLDVDPPPSLANDPSSWVLALSEACPDVRTSKTVLSWLFRPLVVLPSPTRTYGVAVHLPLLILGSRELACLVFSGSLSEAWRLPANRPPSTSSFLPSSARGWVPGEGVGLRRTAFPRSAVVFSSLQTPCQRLTH